MVGAVPALLTHRETETKVLSLVGRTKKTRVCWKTLMCFLSCWNSRILFEVLQIRQDPTFYFTCFLALFFAFPSISFALSNSYWFKWREMDRSLEAPFRIAAPFPSLPGCPLFCWVIYCCATVNAAQNTTDNEWQSWIPCWVAQAPTNFPFLWKIKTQI